MECRVSLLNPENEIEWESLAFLNSNLTASTLFDEIQLFYGQAPVYFQIYEMNKLIFGVKLYEWKSSKFRFFFPKISKGLIQFGECVYDLNESERIDVFINFLNSELRKYLKTNGFVWFRVDGFYGDSNLLLNPFSNQKKNNFDVSWIDLTKDQHVLESSLDKHHKRALAKADSSELHFEIIDDFEIFKSLFIETYRRQGKEAPNVTFIERSYEVLKEKKCVILYGVKHKDEYLATAYVQIYGKKADYSFGGNKKNTYNAGHFLQWNIILDLKNKGLTHYSLGQVAAVIDQNNLKFSTGITEFKLRFGVERKMSFSQQTIIKPFYHKLFNFFLKISGYGSR